MHVFRDGFVKVPAKRMGRFEVPALCPHGHEPVGVNRMNLAGSDAQSCVEDMERVVCWEIVNDARHCVFQPPLEQPRGFFALGFDVGDVGHVRSLERTSVVDHALENECRNPVVGPFVLEGQAFDHHQRFLVFLSKVDGVIEGMIPSGPASCRHPIEDVLPVCVQIPVESETRSGNHACVPLTTALADV